MSSSRLCLLAGGVLDFWSQQGGPPVCLYNGHCPAGSVQQHQQCVAPVEQSQGREIAITLQIGCDSGCVTNEGVDVSGTAWVSVARLLRVPLQETHAALLLMASNFQNRYPLEYFVVRSHVDDSLISSPGKTTDTGESWALFFALRINSARIGAGASEMRNLLGGDVSSLARLSGISASSLHIFAANEKRVAVVDGSQTDLRPYFKIRGYDWNQQPQDNGGSDAHTSAPSTVKPTTLPPCDADCRPTMIGNGKCDTECYNAACSWDVGECAQGSSGGDTSNKLPGCSCETAWLGNGICETFCMYDACMFDGGDCDHGAQTPSTPQPQSAPTPAPASAAPQCGCNSRWVGDGTCDPYCNTLACNYDGGDCSTAPQQPNPQPVPVPSPVAPSSPSASPQPSPSASPPSPSGLRGAAPAAPSNQNSKVMNFQIEQGQQTQGGGLPTWRVVASDPDSPSGKFYVDEEQKENESGNFVTTLVIAIVFAAMGLLSTVAVGLFVQRQKNRSRILPPSIQQHPPPTTARKESSRRTSSQQRQQGQQGLRPSSWADVNSRSESKRSNTSYDSQSTGSTETPPSHGTPNSNSSCENLSSPTRHRYKEAKVWPEPEPGEFCSFPRNSKHSPTIGATSQATAKEDDASKRMQEDPPLPPQFTPEVLEQLKRARQLKESGRKGETTASSTPKPSMPSRLDPNFTTRPQPNPGNEPKASSSQPRPQLNPGNAPKASSSQPRPAAQTVPQSRPATEPKMPQASNSGPRCAAQEDHQRGGFGGFFSAFTSSPSPKQPDVIPNANHHAGKQDSKKNATASFFPSFATKSPTSQPNAAPTGKSPNATTQAGKTPTETPKSNGWFGASSSKQTPPVNQQTHNAKSPPSKSQIQAQKATEKKANGLTVDMMKRLDQARSKPPEERKKVFKDLQRELHPDKNIDQAEAAKLAFQKLMEQREGFLAS